MLRGLYMQLDLNLEITSFYKMRMSENFRTRNVFAAKGAPSEQACKGSTRMAVSARCFLCLTSC